MQILSGLFDHMVLQRNGRNGSEARIRGEVAAAGAVHARVTSKNRPVAGLAHKKIGSANDGVFSATLAGIPVGGPYTVELSVGEESVVVRDVLVGDVWIAAGQSNMQGCGLLSEAAKPQPLCRAFFLDDHWGVAQDPINDIAAAVDQVHIDLCGGVRPQPNGVTGTGPAVAFIQEMRRVTGVPQGVIASAHGGTSMAQWDPAKKADGSKSLYGATLRRFEKNGGRVAGIIWYQGESESMNADAMPVYPEKMKELVESFRRDLKSPKLPIATVQISRIVGWAEFAGWNAVQEMQRHFSEAISHLAVVPAIDLVLDDGIHIGGASQQRLGKRMAGAMLNLLKHPKAGPPPITVNSYTVEPVANRNIGSIVIEFGNVVGELTGGDRPCGFAMLDEKGLNYIFDVRLEKNRAILRTDRAMADIFGKRLFYGYGNDPVCNITDSADRSLPVFSLGELANTTAKRKL